MYILKNGNEVSEKWIIETAQKSAHYLAQVFEEDDANINKIIHSLAKFCVERKEVVAYMNIRRYMKRMKHTLPEHFNELASNNDAFNLYCRQLICCLVIIS